MKKLRLISLTFIAVLALVLMVSPALAELVLVERSTNTKGATTITWDSSFHDVDYSCGSEITMTVNWTVDAGAAAFQDFKLKHFTPRSRKDPADGNVISTTPNGTSVTVVFAFTDLHCAKRRNVDIGNAHFKLYLWIDRDGDGVPESLAGYGVNVHVEAPGCSGC